MNIPNCDGQRCLNDSQWYNTKNILLNAHVVSISRIKPFFYFSMLLTTVNTNTLNTNTLKYPYSKYDRLVSHWHRIEHDDQNVSMLYSHRHEHWQTKIHSAQHTYIYNSVWSVFSVIYKLLQLLGWSHKLRWMKCHRHRKKMKFCTAQ